MKTYKRCKLIKKRLWTAFFWRINRILFKWNGIKYGRNLICNGIILIDIEKDASVRIGNDCFFNSGKGINPLAGNRRGDMYIRSGA